MQKERLDFILAEIAELKRQTNEKESAIALLDPSSECKILITILLPNELIFICEVNLQKAMVFSRKGLSKGLESGGDFAREVAALPERMDDDSDDD